MLISTTMLIRSDSKFDRILLDHAASSGVFQWILLASTRTYTAKARFSGLSIVGLADSITFDYLVDAAGRSGMLSAKSRKRCYVERCRPVWRRKSSAWFEASTDMFLQTPFFPTDLYWRGHESTDFPYVQDRTLSTSIRRSPFSSGVHLAFTGALSAAAAISASIRGHCAEEEASTWRISTSYTWCFPFHDTLIMNQTCQQNHFMDETSVSSAQDPSKIDVKGVG